MATDRINALRKTEQSQRILRESTAKLRNLEAAFIKSTREKVVIQATIDAIQTDADRLEALIGEHADIISQANAISEVTDPAEDP